MRDLKSQEFWNDWEGMGMKHVKSFMAAVMVLAALVFLTGCTESNEKKYSKAQSLMASGQYSEAAAKFDELGSYEEATKLSMYCKAAAAGESGDYDTAFSTFRLLGNYKESEYMITYYAARQEESRGMPGLIRAARTYDSIALFRDSKDRAEACRKSFYDSAVALADSGDYAGAVQMLESLRQDNYRDSAQLLAYYSAFGLEKEGRYLEASAAFVELGEYKDSKDQSTLVLQRAYDAASSLEAEGKQQEAYNIFISLGYFKDSFERACKPYYVKGEELRTAQDWDGAVAAFKQAGRYEDASTQISATRYLEGETKRASHDWNGAIAAFRIAGDYLDSVDQIKATHYAEGEYRLANGDFDGAISVFALIRDYADAETQEKECFYQKAIGLLGDKKYAEAADALRAIGDYKDASTLLSTSFEALYALASEHEKTGDIVRARYYYFKCRGYRDSSSKLEQIYGKYGHHISSNRLNGIYLRLDGTVVGTGSDKQIWQGSPIVAVAGSNLDRVNFGLKADGTVVTDKYKFQTISTWSGIDLIKVRGYTVFGFSRKSKTVYSSYFGDYSNMTNNTRVIRDSAEIKDIELVSGGICYLRENGTVGLVVTNEKYNDLHAFSDVENWDDIIQIAAANFTVVVGLKADGTVVMTGEAYKISGIDISDWHDIVTICIGDDYGAYVVGLKADGSVVTAGLKNKAMDVSSCEDILDICVEDRTIIGLRSDGTMCGFDLRYNNDITSQFRNYKLWD